MLLSSLTSSVISNQAACLDPSNPWGDRFCTCFLFRYIAVKNRSAQWAIAPAQHSSLMNQGSRRLENPALVLLQWSGLVRTNVQACPSCHKHLCMRVCVFCASFFDCGGGRCKNWHQCKAGLYRLGRSPR